MFKIDKEKLVGFEIKTVHNLLKRDFDKLPIHDKFNNLTGVQKWVVAYLSEHEGQDVFQRDLEEEFSIRRSTATGILQLMEKNDLIIRQTVSYDARLKKLVLTKKASEIQHEIHKEIEKHDKKVREGITEEELEERIVDIKKKYGEDMQIFPISAATGQGVKELLYKVNDLLEELPKEEIKFTPEIDLDAMFSDGEDEPFYVERIDETTYSVSGPRVDKMLGYTNLDSTKGFLFFQKFMEQNGIIKELKKLGLSEGDTVRVSDYLDFEYYEGDGEELL